MTEPSAGRYRDALRHRDFRVMLTAFLIDQIGSWAYNVVLIVYVYDRTGSTTWIAATTPAGWIPRILFCGYAGVLADRFERTRTLLVSALLALAAMAGIAIVVAVGGPVLLILFLAGVTAAVGTVYLPASGALIPETGRPVSGILFNLATFAAAALLISRLRVRSTGTAGHDGERLITQVAAGIVALRRNPRARTLVAFAALGTAVYGASTVLYVPMSERFGTGADGYSYLLTAAAIGGVLGAAAVSRLSASPRLSVIIGGGMGSLALPFAATALITSPVIGFVLQVISGGGMVVVDVLALSTLQRDLPRELLSRVIGILETAALAAALAASFAVAALIREVGLTDALLIVGLGFPVITAAGLRPLMRAEARTASAVDIRETGVPVLTEPMLATAACPAP